MARPAQTEIRARIVIQNPVPGVAHSLQDEAGAPLDAKVSISGEALAFEFPVRVAAGPRFHGDFVRAEGKERRFVYIRVGTYAGQADSPWGGRMKIDIHTAAQPQVDKAMAGRILEGVVQGTGKGGGPALATVPLARAWRAV